MTLYSATHLMPISKYAAARAISGRRRPIIDRQWSVKTYATCHATK